VVKMVLVNLGFILLLLTHPAMALSQVNASIDKNPVMVNESFVLEVVADDDVNTNALDTSPLMKDFIVGRTSVSSQTSMINFNTTKITRWTTVLIARQSGVTTIPALTIDGMSTAPIELKILSASDPQAKKQQDLFITSEVSSNSVYVQQQITLTVKLHFSAELKRGSLSEPSLTGADINQIGKDKEAETIVNGRRYRVIERVYALSPQQSGDFTLKSPVFSGEIMVKSNRRSNFLSFGETKPVSVIGDDITLTIKPIPTNYQGAWLPSELLTIHQGWQPDINSADNDSNKNQSTFMVGEPITRTITLTAAGLSEEQLPEILMTVPTGLKVYPDQAELHTGMNSNKLVSQKVRNFALVASKVGTFTLPELIIPWWNTVTNKYQEAKIPAQVITVVSNPELENSSDFNKTEQSSLLNGDLANTKTVIIKEASWLQWLFLALWLLTSLAWLVSSLRKKETTNKTSNNTSTNSIQNTKVTTHQDPYLALLAACKKDQGQQVLSLIVPWVNQLNNKNNAKQKSDSAVFKENISSLDEALAEINNVQFSSLIKGLQACYFGKTEHEWRGKELVTFIQKFNKKQLTSVNETNLTLNP